MTGTSRLRRAFAAGLTAAVALALAPAGAAHSVGAAHDRVVDATPSKLTPNVLDGTVYSIGKLGDKVFLGGKFTQASSAGSDVVLARKNLLAFDATTGVVDPTFLPKIDGQIDAITPGPDNTIYVAGSFTTVSGVKTHFVRLNASTGKIAAGWSTSLDAPTLTSVVSNGVLYVGGSFTTSGGQAHAGIAALDPLTGATLPWLTVGFSGKHGTGRAVSALGPKQIEISPDGTKMVVIGNFTSASDASGTVDRDQIALFDITSENVTINRSWRTLQYTAQCANNAFDSYMREVQFDPTGTYFAIATTGASGTNIDGTKALCDAAARWETAGSGTNVQPTWVDYTGRDTLWTIAVTGTAVYVGGHQRWMNNPNSGDVAGTGSVPRPGIAALDPATGLPLAWNPGRNPRGAGAYALLATDDGLYVGSDTEWIGNYRYHRMRVAHFPLATGTEVAVDTTGTVPGLIVMAGGVTGNARPDVLYRVNAAGPAVTATDGGPDWAVDTSTTPSPLHSSGSSTATYSGTASLDSTVPAGTPTSLFGSERYDSGTQGDTGEMKWSFPVPSGYTVKVRLYFANRYSGTGFVGARYFDVAVEGATVLDNFDIVAATGTNRGTMREFTAVSDGTINVDFGHERDNPLVNAVEILQVSPVPQPLPGVADLRATHVDETMTIGESSVLDSTTMDWSQTRGAFYLGGTLYYGKPTASMLYKRTYNGFTFGPETPVDPYNDPEWADVDSGSGTTQTYRGVIPTLYGQLPTVTSMFYSNHRLYYTLLGQTAMYSRGFVPDSGIVSANATTVADGKSWSDIAGAFVYSGMLYYASKATGALNRIAWTNGMATGTAEVVDTTRNWATRSMFLMTQPVRINQAPVAAFTVDCPAETLTCSFDATASVDGDGSVTRYDWDFGDGETQADGGATIPHTYAAKGPRQVTVTVTDNDGATGLATMTASPTSVPKIIAFRDSAQFAAAGVTSATVTIPATVVVGDGLVLVQTHGSASATSTDPVGWTLLKSVKNGMITKIYSKVASASDAGSTVQIDYSVSGKVSGVVLAYDGTDTAPVAALETAVDAASSSHVTPVAAVTGPGAWVVSIWIDKSNIAASTWTGPAELTTRSTVVGGGGGAPTSLVGDSGAPVDPGTYGGLAASVNSTSTKGTTATLVLAVG